jgi:hypothetical protein
MRFFQCPKPRFTIMVDQSHLIREDKMKALTWIRVSILTVATSAFFAFASTCAASSGGHLNICKLVSPTQLRILYRKHLYPTALDNECFWSERPGAMAEIDIRVGEVDRPLRDYFAKPLPSMFRLVKIRDLGDGGLMTVGEGTIGVVVVHKGNRLLESSPGFLDIKPGSRKQAVLWNIYRRILKKM